jgi:hypothetical protein
MAQGNTLAQAVSVAALTGLLLEGVISLADGKVSVKKPVYTGNAVNDAVIRKILSKEKQRKFRYWTGKFFFRGDRFLKETFKELVQKNVLYERERTFLNIFTYKTYFLFKRKIRERLILQLQTVIYGDGMPDLRQAVLLQLLVSCNLGRIVVRKRADLRIFRKKVKAFRKDERVMGAFSGILGEVKKAAAVSEAVTGAEG